MVFTARPGFPIGDDGGGARIRKLGHDTLICRDAPWLGGACKGKCYSNQRFPMTFAWSYDAIRRIKARGWRDIHSIFTTSLRCTRRNMQPQPMMINSLLVASPTGTTRFHRAPVDWDIRYIPLHCARVAGHIASAHHLTQLATQPGTPTIRVISDLLSEDWVITAHNPNGVTVEDVLSAIHRGLQVPLTQHEWEYMSSTNRDRIVATFYERCEASRDFDRTRHGGVRRIDCLLHTTVFAGLSSLMLRGNQWEVVLTLCRARSRA